MDVKIYIFEDDDYEHFYPLTYNRPVYTLLCGAFKLYEKWHRLFNHSVDGFFCRGELANYVREQSGIKCNRFDFDNCDKAVFINGRILPDKRAADKILTAEPDRIFLTDGNLSAVVVEPQSSQAENLQKMNYWGFGHFKSVINGLSKTELECRWMNYIWDFVAENSGQIESDYASFSSDFDGFDKSIDDLTNVGCLLYSPGRIRVSPQAQIDGQTVLDAREGPIIISDNVKVYSHSRIEGPCYIGPDTQIVGAKVREGCSFGPQCRIGGEVEESIFQGYSNKYHEGFMGHAFLGEWVNLGALTTNSDLKNNYGNIKVDIGIGSVDTELMKVGSFIGDHVKTGIGMLLNTGISIGFGSNIFGGGLIADKYIPPFVWGGCDGYAEYKLEKALQTAGAAMSRRGEQLTAANAALFKLIFEQTQEKRDKFRKDKG
jgi:UDP-N-acetylglucosamine diphosphorylase/glucosamine-1-phosphate N-acetyltransferase